MIGGLSAYSPSAFPALGSSAAPSSTMFRDENGEVCSSFECKTHGALLKAQLQASFPGLTVLGVEPSDEGGGGSAPPPSAVETRRPVAAPPGAGLASGRTLLAAQEGGAGAGEAKAPGELTEEEKRQVAELKQTDARVKAHERAHAAVGGQYAGAPSYDYIRGPDGQMYAVGGEVAIDISAESDPEATLQKATQVAAAALAPADPSGADRAVAAAAAQLRLQALAEIRAEKRAEEEERQAEKAEEPAAGPGSPPAEPPAQTPAETTPAETTPAETTPVASPGNHSPAARAAQAYGSAGRASNDNGAERPGSLTALTA